MIQKFKKLITTLSIVSLFGAPLLVPAVVSADTDCLNGTGGGISECLQSGADKTDENPTGEDASTKVDKTIKLVINVFSLIVGVISVIMIIIGGLKYITSGGDSGNITGAKNTILYAIIGLVIVALAQVVVKFVLEKATQ